MGRGGASPLSSASPAPRMLAGSPPFTFQASMPLNRAGGEELFTLHRPLICCRLARGMLPARLSPIRSRPRRFTLLMPLVL